MGVKGLLLPGALCAPNLTILVPDKDLRKEESHKGSALASGEGAQGQLLADDEGR